MTRYPAKENKRTKHLEKPFLNWWRHMLKDEFGYSRSELKSADMSFNYCDAERLKMEFLQTIMSGLPRPRRMRRHGFPTRQYMPNSYPIRLEQAMDDLPVFGPTDMPRSEVLLGTYGSEEWIFADAIRNRHLDGKSTIQRDITWIVPSEFDLADWVLDHVNLYTFFGADRCVTQDEEGLMKLSAGRGKLEVEIIGDPKWVKKWTNKFDDRFRRAENLIEWVYSERGDTISVPLNYRPAIQAAYPWIQKDLNDYIDDYLNSDASVLILIGKPGTGKTTFIKNLIHRSRSDAKVAYDEKVMMGDGLFANFIDDDSRFLIMEDADAFLQSRTDGNTMMHKFLNVSDGLISAADKKLVFSTNLDKVTDIDSALMRPGRCFDVIEFRELTRDEAQAVIDETHAGHLPEGKDKITLAEIFSTQPSANVPRRNGKIGFIK